MILVTSTTATHRVASSEEFEEFYGSVSFSDALQLDLLLQATGTPQLEATHTSMLTTVWR